MNKKIASALLLVLVLASQLPAQVNIVQIIADDMGWTDLSSGATNLGNGSGFYQTPNIDALAAGGMSFSSAYVQQSCAPTRAALLTGQYATRNRLYNVGSLNTIGNSTLLEEPINSNSIQNGAVTIAELLRNAGFVTAHIGKFHATGNANQITTQHGFQVNIGGTSSGGPNGVVPYFAQESQPGVWEFGTAHGPEFDAYANPYSQNYVADNLLPYANGNDPTVLADSPKHLNDAMADAAVDFLGQRAADRAPFFVNVAFNAVHSEINSRSDLESKYAGVSGTADHSSAAYAGLLEGMDQAVGRIVDFVEASGLSNNTLIVFMSDNGGVANVSGNFPLSGSKGTFREGGIRAPLIVYQPGVVPAATISDQTVHAVDMYKTYAELAGVALPAPATHALDGESLASIVQGNSSQLERDTIFYYFPGYTNNIDPVAIAIHDGADGNNYKLTYHLEDRSFELYDLTTDISETNELIANGMSPVQFGIASCAAQALGEWLVESEADLPTVRATGNTIPGISHTPAIRFDLSNNGFGQQIDGLSSAVLEQLGIELTLEAVGQNGLLGTSNAGIGVVSDLDTGNNNTQRRIDGSLNIPELINVSFNRDVVIKNLLTNQLSSDGSETVIMERVSGDDPFAGLSGYNANGFNLQNNALTFVRSDNGNNNFGISIGALDQDELLVTAGTVISISTNPSVQGGFALRAINVAIPGFVLGDANMDGAVNLLDVASFVQQIGSGSYSVESDANKDGVVNLLDVGPFVAALSGQ